MIVNFMKYNYLILIYMHNNWKYEMLLKIPKLKNKDSG